MDTKYEIRNIVWVGLILQAEVWSWVWCPDTHSYEETRVYGPKAISNCVEKIKDLLS